MAVVCDKLRLTESETARRAKEPGYRFSENSVYDSLMRELFGKFHRLADRYAVTVARRGNSSRNEAIKTAIAHAELDFERKFGFRRSRPDAWEITVLRSNEAPCLQAADYFLWAREYRNPEGSHGTRPSFAHDEENMATGNPTCKR